MPVRSFREDALLAGAGAGKGRFQLGVMGLSRLERTMIGSVCSLTNSRVRGYTMLPEERCPEADITVVDADDAEAYASWRESEPCRSGRPALMLTANAEATAAKGLPYCLPRNNFAARLLKMLDRITIREFKYVPELVIGEDQPAFDASALAHSAGRVDRNAPRVLVIDDSLVIRTRLQVALQLNGFEVDLAADAETALELVTEQRYAVVLLDVVLPGIDGYTACRNLRTSAGDPSLPIVMLTGRSSTFDRVRGLMAGCTRYLTKPVNAEELRKLLAELTSRSG